MSYLHVHTWTTDEEGTPTEEEYDLAVTGPVRVQAMTASGLKSFEMHEQGLQTVEMLEGDVPEEETPAAKSSTSSSKSSSS
jgi:hypothetical protein